MKQKMLLLALIGAICAPQALHAKACVNPVSVVCPQVDCGTNVVHISQADVGPGGLVLDTPGTRYCFVESITWTPPVAPPTLHRSVPGPTEPIAAITITANNIELDLNGYTLQQSGDANYTIGIFITNGSAFGDTSIAPLNNIIVRNGTVQNIATAGIYVNKVNELLFEDLYVTNNGSANSGYFLDPAEFHLVGGIIYPTFASDVIFLKNHVWRNVHCDSNFGDFPDPSGLYAVVGGCIQAVDGVVIENCTFNDNVCGTNVGGVGGVYGLAMGCTNAQIVNCQANGNSSVGPLGDVFGYNASLTNFSFENCQANSNTGSYSCEGFIVGPTLDSGVMNGVFSNCTANNNTAAGIYTVAPFIGFSFCIGFDVEGIGNVFYNCQANNNTAPLAYLVVPGLDTSGFYFNSTNATYVDCQANNNSSLFAATNGFFLEGASHVEYIRCTADGNMVTGTLPGDASGTTSAKGFALVSSDDITLRDCVAVGQTVELTNAPSLTPACGFSLESVTNAYLDNCIGSESSALVPFGAAAGFHMDGLYITLNNCRAEENDGTLGSNQYEIENVLVPNPTNVNILNSVAIGDPTQANSVGILLQNALDCVIEGNVIESNVLDGILLTGTCPDNGQNVIKHNQILAPNPFSYSGALTGIWAIEDDTASDESSPTNVYYDNYAFDYPGNVPGMTNYNTGVREAGGGLPGTANQYIAPWTVPGLPPSYTGVTKLTNLDITYIPCVTGVL